MSTQDVTGADLFAPLRGSGNPGKEPTAERTSDAARSGVGGVLPPVLDVCCGCRMFWYDKADVRALYMDKRRETFVQVRTDCGNKTKSVNPDILADFTNIPFPDNSFHLVVFDPPHVIRKEAKGSITMHYGHLTGNWKEMLRKGFRECFRVLKPNGTLIFKWSEIEIPLRDVLAMTPERPLFGHRVGRRELSHWCAFLKGGGGAEQGADVIERE